MHQPERRKKLCIGISVAPTWLSGEGWRDPGSGIEGLYASDLALDVARRAEAAHLDFVFRPDASFLPMQMMDQSFGFSSLDPTLLMAALARETSRIGLITTISTTFGHPYSAARQMMSLHWLSKGRAGWNVVTALQGNENFGLPEMPSSESRYARAAEFTDVVRRLWSSFPPEALVVDRARGRYADTDLLLPIDHQGANFTVRGPLNLPQYPGPRIPLMQAGGSKYGVDFAGQMADMVFAQTPDLQSAQALRSQLSDRARAHHRQPRDIRLLPGLSLYLGETKAEAEALFLATNRRVDRGQRIARVKEFLGLDLGDWPGRRRLSVSDLPEGFVSPRCQTDCDALRQIIRELSPTVDEFLARPEILASVHWQVIGTPEDAASEIAAWFRAGAVDGFIAVPGGSVRSLDLLMDRVVPALAQQGLFRASYSADTLLGHLEDS